MNVGISIFYNAQKLTLLSPVAQTMEPIKSVKTEQTKLADVLFITSFPPRECGIAAYTQDLIKSINKGFGNTFNIKICALESDQEEHHYDNPVKYKLHTGDPASYHQLVTDVNSDKNIRLVVLQHEFGLFGHNGSDLIEMLSAITKPVAIVFHTVLPEPDQSFRKHVQDLASEADSLIVMTQSSSQILVKEYNVKKSKIQVIPHGTHLIKHGDRENLKAKYGLQGKNVLSTFGFLGAGKSVETTLQAMPSILATHPETMFLIIGKTHPTTIKREGEAYRNSLKQMVDDLNLGQHVIFVNAFLPLHELLEYLQLTDVYLFTSKDPNQAVSGTFAYAISCGCPIISTPIPHALEVLKDGAGIIIDFQSPIQLANAVNHLLNDSNYRTELSMTGLHKMAATAWENSAIAHANIIKDTMVDDFKLQYKLPDINLAHIQKLTTDIGMIQFSQINIPDPSTGYTLDDNARAMVTMCQHYALTKDEEDIKLIRIYNDFIKRCLQKEGNFLNYIDIELNFTKQNDETNLEDSNGRALWALGFLMSKANLLPKDIITSATTIFDTALESVKSIHSTRAMSFIIKGLYFANLPIKNTHYTELIDLLSQRLLKMYLHESEASWLWYESYLTYGNSIIPEALLCAYLSTGNLQYKDVAKTSFDFLLSKTYIGDKIQLISNQTWLHKNNKYPRTKLGGEQP